VPWLWKIGPKMPLSGVYGQEMHSSACSRTPSTEGIATSVSNVSSGSWGTAGASGWYRRRRCAQPPTMTT